MNNSLRVYESILELLPNESNPTPLVRLNSVNPFKKLQIYAKLEWYNPFGAVKDRIVANMLEDAEKKGLINGKKLIEPTSGNTGIAMAAIANIKNYGFRTTISSGIPQEKKDVLKFLGAEIIEVSDSLCPDPTSPEGAIGVAKSTVQNLPNKFYMPNQYENEANLEAHYKTTGPEVWRQTQGKITHFIAGLGTCGTISGAGKFLKEKNSKIKIIGIHPEENHDIPGVRSLKQLKVTKLFMPELYEDIVEVSNKESYDMCLRLNREESIIAGPSSGMVFAGALKILKDEEGLAVIVFPDNLFKYTTFLAKNFPDIIEGRQVVQQPVFQTPAQMAEQMFNAMVQLARNEYNTLEVKQAREWIEKDKPIIIDVRHPFIYFQGHVPNAKNIPLQEMIEKKGLPEDKNSPILTVCNVGNTSLMGMLFLKALGYRNVKSLNKGTMGWIQEGYEVEY